CFLVVYSSFIFGLLRCAVQENPSHFEIKLAWVHSCFASTSSRRHLPLPLLKPRRILKIYHRHRAHFQGDVLSFWPQLAPPWYHRAFGKAVAPQLPALPY